RSGFQRNPNSDHAQSAGYALATGSEPGQIERRATPIEWPPIAALSRRLGERLSFAKKNEVGRRSGRNKHSAIGNWYAQHEDPVARALPESLSFVDAVDQDPAHDHHHRHQRRQRDDETQRAKKFPNN